MVGVDLRAVVLFVLSHVVSVSVVFVTIFVAFAFVVIAASCFAAAVTCVR